MFPMTVALSQYTQPARIQLQNHTVPSLLFVLGEDASKHHRDSLTFCYLNGLYDGIPSAKQTINFTLFSHD